MSGQMSDVIVVDGAEWAIVEPSNPEELFDARAHSIKPVMLHTANTRGVSARYRVHEGQLQLSELQVGSIDAPPALGNVEATTDEYGQTWTYLDVDIDIAFTGDLVVGAEPILELYVHAGFLPMWHYESVMAFTFLEGMLQSQQDRSDQAREVREEHTNKSSDSTESSEDSEPEEPKKDGFEGFLSSLMSRFGFDD